MAKVHADRHAPHGADLHVEDHEVDPAALDAGADVVPVGNLLNDEVGPLEHGAKLVAKRREIAREQYRGHET